MTGGLWLCQGHNLHGRCRLFCWYIPIYSYHAHPEHILSPFFPVISIFVYSRSKDLSSVSFLFLDCYLPLWPICNVFASWVFLSSCRDPVFFSKRQAFGYLSHAVRGIIALPQNEIKGKGRFIFGSIVIDICTWAKSETWHDPTPPTYRHSSSSSSVNQDL